MWLVPVSRKYFAIKRIQKDVEVMILISLTHFALHRTRPLRDQSTGIGYARRLSNVITSANISISVAWDKWVNR
jgi:hypothetical protein